ncbi:MAG: type III pantothenate kinase [Bacteroidales bacterium]|nr:type III pantothenate kinase [Bacteroidales bacterium]
MNLVIDIGNTLQKIAIFNNDEIIYAKSMPFISNDILLFILKQFSIKFSIISSVSELSEQVVDFLNLNTKLIHYSYQTKLPITILYRSIETLGLDRIANAVGAAALFPSKNVLAVQAGTCLVFDFVNERSEYLGGSISPGLRMRFETLHEKTKNLPHLEENDTLLPFLGTNTNESVLSGVVIGMCHEIDGFIDDYKANYENTNVIFTGGDFAFFQKSIKNTIFAAPNLVLKGLNEIIKYNV